MKIGLLVSAPGLKLAFHCGLPGGADTLVFHLAPRVHGSMHVHMPVPCKL
jgi:hypothetical protein